MVNLEIGILCALLASSLALPYHRIVAGINAKEGQFPHQISLKLYGFHVCGGSIIADKWVVTAAHCILKGIKVSRYTVSAGTILETKGGTTVGIKSSFVHENYKDENVSNDIALLELLESLKFTQTINSIEIARNEVPTDGSIIISGWGSIYPSKVSSLKNLQYNINFIKRLSPEKCKRILRNEYYDGLLCLEHGRGYGACDGDSGGPALHNGELVGIASFILGECGSKNPDGYTKISYFRDWINEKTVLNL